MILHIENQEDAAIYLNGDYLPPMEVEGIKVCRTVRLSAVQIDKLKRMNATIRKRLSRQGKEEILLPLPAGTAAALDRVMKSADFDDARDFIAFQIHRLDELLKCDGHKFAEQAKRTVTVGDLSKYHGRIGHVVQDDEE